MCSVGAILVGMLRAASWSTSSMRAPLSPCTSSLPPCASSWLYALILASDLMNAAIPMLIAILVDMIFVICFRWTTPFSFSWVSYWVISAVVLIAGSYASPRCYVCRQRDLYLDVCGFLP